MNTTSESPAVTDRDVLTFTHSVLVSYAAR